jgi:hypothetical protein
MPPEVEVLEADLVAAANEAAAGDLSAALPLTEVASNEAIANSIDEVDDIPRAPEIGDLDEQPPELPTLTEAPTPSDDIFLGDSDAVDLTAVNDMFPTSAGDAINLTALDDIPVIPP